MAESSEPLLEVCHSSCRLQSRGHRKKVSVPIQRHPTIPLPGRMGPIVGWMRGGGRQGTGRPVSPPASLPAVLVQSRTRPLGDQR